MSRPLPSRCGEPEQLQAGAAPVAGRLGGSVDLVVTDLDGTLWDGTGIMHPRTRAAVDMIREASLPLLVATGRRAASAWPVMELNDIALPAVLLDGAVGNEFRSPRPFCCHPFPRALAGAVLEAFESLGVGPCVNVDPSGTDDAERDIVIGERTMTHPEYLRRLLPFVREEDLHGAVATLPVLAFTVVAPDMATARRLALGVTFATGVAAAVSADRTLGGVHLSFRSPGVSKWSGVSAYCALEGLDPDRVLAIGDADNDLELLRKASFAVVVADGSPGALELADAVVPPAGDGGWAELTSMLGLRESG